MLCKQNVSQFESRQPYTQHTARIQQIVDKEKRDCDDERCKAMKERLEHERTITRDLVNFLNKLDVKNIEGSSILRLENVGLGTILWEWKNGKHELDALRADMLIFKEEMPAFIAEGTPRRTGLSFRVRSEPSSPSSEEEKEPRQTCSNYGHGKRRRR